MNGLIDILVPPLLAGLVILSTHVPLGREVLSRGIIFLDIAIAQIAACGVILAGLIGSNETPWTVQLIATASALAGAFALQWTERRFPAIQEALIGTSFVLAASAALLLVAGNPHGAEHIADLLRGQILWVNTASLWALLAINLPVALIWWRSPTELRRRLFYPLFAVAITASVQQVGVYLVFSSLIIPALAVRRQRRHAVPTGWLVGAMAYGLGLSLSALFDWPAGPVIVWSLALLAVPLAFRRSHITPH